MVIRNRDEKMSTSNNVDARTLIFLHIPKAAGITLREIIQKQYGPQYVATISAPDEEVYQEVKSLVLEERQNLKVIQGHMPFGIHQLIKQPSTYITMLREPIDRIISFYYYVLQSPDNGHYHAVTTLGLSLADYIQSGLLEDNGQTRRIAGLVQPLRRSVGSRPKVKCTRETFEIAKRNLEEHFSVVGIVEMFYESLWMIKKEFGWKLPFFVNRNVTRSRLAVGEIPKETLELIKNHTIIDQELYEYARSLCERRIQEQGNSFYRELALYKVLNRCYGRLFPIYYSIKHDYRKEVKRVDSASAELQT